MKNRQIIIDYLKSLESEKFTYRVTFNEVTDEVEICSLYEDKESMVLSRVKELILLAQFYKYNYNIIARHNNGSPYPCIKLY